MATPRYARAKPPRIPPSHLNFKPNPTPVHVFTTFPAITFEREHTMRTLTLQDLEAASTGLHAGYVPRNMGFSGAPRAGVLAPITDFTEEPGLPFDELFPGLEPSSGPGSDEGKQASPDVGIPTNGGELLPPDESPADWWSAHGGAFGA
jgi:hypothetical protein